MKLTTLSLVASAVLVATMPALANKPPRFLTDMFNKATTPSSAQTPAHGGAQDRTLQQNALSRNAVDGVDGVADSRYSFSADGSEVRDGQSGITWKRCAEGMNWTGATCAGNATVFSALTRVLAYGKTISGWRIPTIDELKTLANVYPAHENRVLGPGGIDGAAFPATPAEAFWTTTLYYKERGDRDRTKIVHFGNGVEYFNDNGEPGRLRLVRTGNGVAAAASPVPLPIQRPVGAANTSGGPRYAVSANGAEVTDSSTGLIWRRCAEGMMYRGGNCVGTALSFDFDAAESRAKAQARATRTEWRLPTKEDLLSIADERKFKMAIDTSAFPGTPPEHFWTSHRIDSNYVYAVNFYNGFHYDRYQTSQHHVRLVRDAK